MSGAFTDRFNSPIRTAAMELKKRRDAESVDLWGAGDENISS